MKVIDVLVAIGVLTIVTKACKIAIKIHDKTKKKDSQ